MRAHNLSLLLHRIWAAEDISRVALSRETGLARSTVTNIVNELVELGIVEESHPVRTGGGRPPIALRVRDEAFHLVGIEMGASHLTLLRTDLRGRRVTAVREQHDVQGDPDGTMAWLRDTLEQTLADTAAPPILGVGLAVPSPLDPSLEGELSARILPRWAGRRPADELRDLTGQPVFMQNDANLGALAELWWGQGREATDFAYIKVATGVGSGLIMDREIYGGASGLAGEIGHIAVDPSGARCRCGLSGCLEAMVGSGSLLRRHAELARESDGSPASPRDLAELIALARAGDALALQVVEESGHHLGVAVANLLNLVNPRLVVLGGRLTEAGDLLLAPLRRAARARALSASIDRTAILISGLGKEAVALGAATLVLQQALDDPSMFPLPSQQPSTPHRARART